MLKKEEFPLVSFRRHPELCHAIAQSMKRQGINSRPEWLTSAIEQALVQGAGK